MSDVLHKHYYFVDNRNDLISDSAALATYTYNKDLIIVIRMRFKIIEEANDSNQYLWTLIFQMIDRLVKIFTNETVLGYAYILEAIYSKIRHLEGFAVNVHIKNVACSV